MLRVLMFLAGLVCVISTNTLHLVGDSQCVGASLVANTLLETKRWTTIKATCKNGTRTEYWASHVDDAHIQPGDSVIVYLGSNDWGKPDAKPILAKLKGTNCVWVGPPLIRGKDNGVADHLKREVVTDGTCKFLDSRTLDLKLPDGVHTSEPSRWLRIALKMFEQV
jgi:hypothetical protein